MRLTRCPVLMPVDPTRSSSLRSAARLLSMVAHRARPRRTARNATSAQISPNAPSTAPATLIVVSRFMIMLGVLVDDKLGRPRTRGIWGVCRWRRGLAGRLLFAARRVARAAPRGTLVCDGQRGIETGIAQAVYFAHFGLAAASALGGSMGCGAVAGSAGGGFV